jgi:flavin reductase (DIM6/NTAB) family NADH-FMN oxidoreductase RutF
VDAEAGVALDVMDEAARLAFRQAMGTFATGVALIAARDAAGAAHVITVNSFTSVSLEPPLILWCLGDQSDRFTLFASAETFGVTVCAAGQRAQALRFAGRAPPAAADVIERGGAPLVAGGLAHLACRAHARIAMGDHMIIVGRVVWLGAGMGDALTYFRGRFGAAPQEG